MALRVPRLLVAKRSCFIARLASGVELQLSWLGRLALARKWLSFRAVGSSGVRKGARSRGLELGLGMGG